MHLASLRAVRELSGADLVQEQQDNSRYAHGAVAEEHEIPSFAVLRGCSHHIGSVHLQLVQQGGAGGEHRAVRNFMLVRVYLLG